MVISFLNQKGGVGKTTLAINVAATLSSRGSRVLAIDCDPQGSFLCWSAARGGDAPFGVIGLPKPTVHKEIKHIGTSCDYVIIDGAPRVTDLARSVIAASDVVVVPVSPSPLDFWAVDEVLTLISEAEIHQPNLKFVFALNRCVHGTAISKSIVAPLAKKGTVLSTPITQRVVFAESFGEGKFVHEMQGADKAIAEINAIVDEIIGVGAAEK